MDPKRLVLTAGFDRALPSIALAELLRRDGHDVRGVLVVSPFSLGRARQLVRQRGLGMLASAARRLVDRAPAAARAASLVEQMLVEHDIRGRSLAAWCREAGVAHAVVKDLDDPAASAFVTAQGVDALVYGGGGILREPMLRAAGGIVLNAHAGPLPHVRGMNACEWSLLLGHDPCVTIHLIDRGIDTGGVLDVVPLTVEPGDTIERLREKSVVASVVGLRRVLASLDAHLARATVHAERPRQCFVLAPVLREALARKLAREAP